MKMASVNEFRSGLADMMDGEETIVVTRHGKLKGFYIPWYQDNVPLEIKRAAFKNYRKELDKAFKEVEIDEKEMIADFAKFRRNRRNRRR